MFSAKQGNYLVPFLYRLWYDAVLDWGLNPGPPALEASTIPLGYRGGGNLIIDNKEAIRNFSYSSLRTCNFTVVTV